MPGEGCPSLRRRFGYDETRADPSPFATSIAEPAMIRTLRLQNFKGIRDVEVGLERLTVFVGCNGSGKTSFLEALHYHSRLGAEIARRALNDLRNLRQDGQQIDGILLLRDDDGNQDHKIGLEQARNSVPDLSGRVVIGLAHYKRECWVLNRFVPANDRETALVAELRRELSFDPIIQSHRLTAKLDHELRSAKRVLGELTQHQWEREEACWAQTPLATLRERGGPSGLAAFLAEVADRLVPLFAGRRSAGRPTAL